MKRIAFNPLFRAGDMLISCLPLFFRNIAVDGCCARALHHHAMIESLGKVLQLHRLFEEC
jgi:hypothetical protein